ncbi:hypothetical protein ASPACDRAFT_55868 [Aspergillus aculeatus ATCC 16872]|uniref:ORC6 first cyclin-like domain-containing protein n=1 Tax=Aspergillus aculeatus (strain ATCC 16872 / CBS 172.66 / WB 5094) TaxID=690307 RepID=A0A1L9X7S0_ASPA1|nr:uncharacterized protein ASPACDRAFT_55868 [Aspergillus aculeatus ATCC 16872]OJK04379.1 hypothetical protein ASPACDRAFT_55868 [Aspergillus aculeatus ATCC 16872]
MNNRPVEQALATLLPTHAQDLPPDLLSLAVSLVAQSRSLSSSLKPEEEIARPYACAEIACRRLTRTLKLPPLLGHPPCPPRSYKKLYAFLDRSLSGGSSSAPGTPSRSRTTPSSTPTKANRLTQTPSKNPLTTGTTAALQNTPTKSSPLKRSLPHDSTKTATSTSTPRPRPKPTSTPNHLRLNAPIPTSTKIPDAPDWVMASIRTVCKTLSTPAPRMSTWSRPPISRTLAPHIFAGVSSILFFVTKTKTTMTHAKHDEDLDDEMLEFLEPVLTAARNSDASEAVDEEYKEIVDALIVAVYFLVLARRRQPADEDAQAGEAGEDAKVMDKKTFTEMRQTALVSLGLPATERRHREDVDQWIALIMEQGWAHGTEWFENIPRAGEVDGDAEFLDDEGENWGEEDGGGGNGGGGVGAPRHKKQRFQLGRETRRGLLPGLGTMMQDRVDWLSEDRREDFLIWKAEILARCDQIEKAALAA